MLPLWQGAHTLPKGMPALLASYIFTPPLRSPILPLLRTACASLPFSPSSDLSDPVLDTVCPRTSPQSKSADDVVVNSLNALEQLRRATVPALKGALKTRVAL